MGNENKELREKKELLADIHDQPNAVQENIVAYMAGMIAGIRLAGSAEKKKDEEEESRDPQ